MKRILFLCLLAAPAFAQIAGQINQNASGTITASSTSCSATGCVYIVLPLNAASASIALTGTWSATLQFEVSVDNLSWFSIANSSSATSTTSTGLNTFTLSGQQFLRVRCSAYTSGSIAVAMVGTVGTGPAGATGPTGPTGPSGLGTWNAITNPTGNLALTMGANTTMMTYNATTGAATNLWTETDTASNTGTGILHRFTTASGSALTPWQADAQTGLGWSVSTTGVLASVGYNALVLTPTISQLCQNTTAATTGTRVQVSPLCNVMSANVWNTSGTPASNTELAGTYLLPVSGVTPSATMEFGFNLNGGGWTNPMSLTSGGQLTLSSGVVLSFNGGLGLGTTGAGNIILFNGSDQVLFPFGLVHGLVLGAANTSSVQISGVSQSNPIFSILDGNGGGTAQLAVGACAPGGVSGSFCSTNGTLSGTLSAAKAAATLTVLTANLQTCTASTGTPWRASVSDATAPTIGVALTGGGAIFANVHCSLTTGTYIVDSI